MPGRPTDWMDVLLALNPVDGGQAVVGLSSALVPADSARATIIRTIISLGVFSDSVAGAWGVQAVDLAIGIASQEAFAASIFPDPNIGTDKPARGWLWRTRVFPFQNGVGTPVVLPVVADIRGARKIENGEVYLIAINANVEGTAFPVHINGLVRTLIKI